MNLLDNEKVYCPICNDRIPMTQITYKHLKKHNLTLPEFKDQYSGYYLINPVLEERTKQARLKGKREKDKLVVEKPCWNCEKCGNYKVLVNINVGNTNVTCDECRSKNLFHPLLLKHKQWLSEQAQKINKDENIIKKRTDTLNNRSVEEIEEWRTKREKTLIEKDGQDWKQIQLEKTKAGMKDLYGKEFAFQVDEMRDQAEQTLFERKGVTNAMHDPEIVENIRIIKLKNRKERKVDIIIKKEVLEDEENKIVETFIKGKNLITTANYVTCPYCGESSEYLHWKHLLSHEKTLDDVRIEFPDHPTLTKIFDNKRSIATEKSKKYKDEKKKVKCICGDTEFEVGKYYASYIYSECCRTKGISNPDKRSNGTGEKTRQKNLQKKYGEGITNAAHIDGVIEKRSKTNDERYGGTGFGSDELATKTREVIMEKYGAENIMQTEEGKQHFIGSNNPMSKENPESESRRKSLSEVIKGQPSKLRERDYEDIHGKEKGDQLRTERSEHFRQKFMPDLNKALEFFELDLLDSEYKGAHYKHKWKCKKCSTEYEQIWNSIQQGYQCPKCFPRNVGDSKSEREIRDFISTFGFEFKINIRNIIAPKELDIYFPDKKIAIEHNGIYRHSELNLSKSYHIKKTIACEKLGIRLIHIFEDEWVYKKEIVKERLKYILGCSTSIRINARDCIIKEISNSIKDDFLKKYHIQGTDIGSSIRLGAYHNDELVSIMTFSKLNISKGSQAKEGYWELSRFCSSYSYIVNGIAGKLLSHFKNNYSWIQILTYADRRWSSGNLYKKLGFEGGQQTSIDYWYSKGGLERISRFKMRKKVDEPKDIPEHILRAKEGYFRIYGCGNLRFTLENK